MNVRAAGKKALENAGNGGATVGLYRYVVGALLMILTVLSGVSATLYWRGQDQLMLRIENNSSIAAAVRVAVSELAARFEERTGDRYTGGEALRDWARQQAVDDAQAANLARHEARLDAQSQRLQAGGL